MLYGTAKIEKQDYRKEATKKARAISDPAFSAFLLEHWAYV